MGRVARALFSFSGRRRDFLRSLADIPEGPLRGRLERIADSFVAGYHAALEDSRPEPLAARLGGTALELQGFAYEGAGLGLALLDAVTPPWWQNRLASFARGPGRHQVYMLHVGSGWLLGRLPVSVPGFLSRLHPLFGWLSLDGFGFHEAFHDWSSTVERQRLPARVWGPAVRPFDTGVGRRLWFTPGAGVNHIPRIIAAFPPQRQGGLWVGVGEACAFAGGRGPEGVLELRRAAGPFVLDLAQGAAFAAQVRALGGDPAPHTETACRILCGTGAAQAAALTVQALAGLPGGGAAFEAWGRRTQDLLGASLKGVDTWPGPGYEDRTEAQTSLNSLQQQ